MNMKRISRNMTGLVFVLILMVTAAIMLMGSDSEARTNLFWTAFGFLLFSELLMGLNFADIAGSASDKGMPFKVAQSVVSTAYFIFALGMTVLAGKFNSISTYSITQMIPALGMSIFTIAFSTAQYVRRSSDTAEATGRASKAGIQLLLTDLIEEIKELPAQDELKPMLNELNRISENMRYVAETVPGAEKDDQAVVLQIQNISEQFAKADWAMTEERPRQIEPFMKAIHKLEHLFKQREFNIKQLR